MLPPQPAQWISIAGNIFSICGLAGVINAQRDLVTAYFAWSAVQMVPAPGLTGYEKATAFFLLLQVLLAVCATGGLLGVCIHKRMHTRMNAPCDRRVGVSRCSAREAVLAC
jgi:hypothetical protein